MSFMKIALVPWRRVLRTPSPYTIGSAPSGAKHSPPEARMSKDRGPPLCGAKHSPPGAKMTKDRGPPKCVPGDPLSQVNMCQMQVKLTIGIWDHNIF